MDLMAPKDTELCGYYFSEVHNFINPDSKADIDTLNISDFSVDNMQTLTAENAYYVVMTAENSVAISIFPLGGGSAGAVYR
jgi:hypothetical protein